MKKIKQSLPFLVKTVIGALFIISAIAKIVEMDKFELYVYSYHFFSLNFTFIVARIAIVAELALGIALLSMLKHKSVWWASTIMVAGYTLFLLYAVAIGRSDSCHCFGELVDMNPWQSILKNAGFLILLALAYPARNIEWRFAWHSLAIACIACGITVFTISPPDNFTPNYKREGNINTEVLDNIIQDSIFNDYALTKGKQVVCFFTPVCEFCQMAAKKISLMHDFYGNGNENITYIFLMGDEKSIDKFFNKSESNRYRYVIYTDVPRLLSCTNGEFPNIAFLEDGKLVYQTGLRDMHEDVIEKFFRNE